jgi:hypothetical protein
MASMVGLEYQYWLSSAFSRCRRRNLAAPSLATVAAAGGDAAAALAAAAAELSDAMSADAVCG